MAIDYTKSPDEIIVQLINDENQRNFTVNDLDLTNVAVAPDPVFGRQPFNNRRTSVRVAAVPGSGYTNEVTVKYNRVHLRDVFPHEAADDVRYAESTEEFQLGERTQLAELLPEINAKYGINIRLEDIFEVALPTFDGPPPEGGYPAKFVRLEMKMSSKVFVGGIQLRILPNDWDLSNMQHTELNGLYYPGYDVPASWDSLDDTVELMATPGYFGN